nr:hypothetical protein [Saprospiraceae bacterium]
GIVSDGDLYRLFINLFGARQEGVRLTILLPERTGELKVISQTIADMGGNIISLLICDGKDVTSKMCILKVSGIDRPKLVEAIQPFALEIIDVR